MIISVIFFYILILFCISYIIRKKGNADFFSANKNSPWYVVAFGMIGASMSGVSVVSVPGMVRGSGFSYLQMAMGFVAGYFLVAYVLLPLYYKLNLTSIYGYLKERFGEYTHKTGALYFILFKMISASVRLYVVVLVLQKCVLEAYGVSFGFTVFVSVLVIYIYTFRSGIKSVVWTDFFQTFCMIVALILLFADVISGMDKTVSSIFSQMLADPRSQIFYFDGFMERTNFFKQFLSGVFVVFVMTGLDQDVMQKNLTCRSLKESQKNMLTYGFFFIPVNFILLSLGLLLLMTAEQSGGVLPVLNDEILPSYIMTANGLAVVCFVIGIVAAAFTSADSALVSLTTSVAVDILGKRNMNVWLRVRIHFAITLLFYLLIIIFGSVENKSAIDTIYSIVSYLYGPLLGLFLFGITTRKAVKDTLVPPLSVLSPVLTYAVVCISDNLFSYKFGYELLLLNGFFMYSGLFLISQGNNAGKHSEKLVENKVH